MSGTCKLAFSLVVAALVTIRTSAGQAPPAPTLLTDPLAPGAEAGAECPSPGGTCNEEPSSGWSCCRPFSALLARLQADCEPMVPWVNWSQHPLSIGCFGGMVNGGPLIDDWVGDTYGFYGGWRLGWDTTPNLGLETRFAFGTMKLYDSISAKAAMEKLDQATGQAPIGVGRNAELFQWDVELLYYPWGETRLRPYLLTGMGLSNIYFTDRLGESYQVTSLSLPVGVGVKYLCSEQLAFRLDLLDDIALSSDHLQVQQNLALTIGVELRFGGSRKVYWPWDTGSSFW